VAVAIRTLVDPANPKDIGEVHALQDAIQVSQQSPWNFEVPDWDPMSQKKVRDALLALGSTLADFKKAFGAKEQVDPIRHLVASAAAWGGNPDKDATYLNITPAKNDGATVYRLGIKDVPVDGFWSVSVYNAEGYFQKNPYDAYTLNNITAKKSADGSVVIQFGGCDGKVLNCLPIEPGWNYTVRLYRPRPNSQRRLDLSAGLSRELISAHRYSRGNTPMTGSHGSASSTKRGDETVQGGWLDMVSARRFRVCHIFGSSERTAGRRVAYLGR
jgi:hypothetical protein